MPIAAWGAAPAGASARICSTRFIGAIGGRCIRTAQEWSEKRPRNGRARGERFSDRSSTAVGGATHSGRMPPTFGPRRASAQELPGAVPPDAYLNTAGKKEESNGLELYYAKPRLCMDASGDRAEGRRVCQTLLPRGADGELRLFHTPGTAHSARLHSQLPVLVLCVWT